jgi:hypothetical protein
MTQERGRHSRGTAVVSAGRGRLPGLRADREVCSGMRDKDKSLNRARQVR